MPNKGFRGFRAFSPASSFVSVDNNVLRNHLLGIVATVTCMLKKRTLYMKSNESIKNIAIASIKRHSIAINQWDKTRISLSDFTSLIDRLDDELPVVEFILNERNWTIITTKRIVGQIDANQNQVDFTELDDIVYGNYKDIKFNTTIFRTIDLEGDSIDFLMETGNPSIAFIDSINTIFQFYRNEFEQT